MFKSKLESKLMFLAHVGARYSPVAPPETRLGDGAPSWFSTRGDCREVFETASIARREEDLEREGDLPVGMILFEESPVEQPVKSDAPNLSLSAWSQTFCL